MIIFLFVGLVDWKEYYVHFLLAKGHPIDKALKHIEDYDEIDLKFEGMCKTGVHLLVQNK